MSLNAYLIQCIDQKIKTDVEIEVSENSLVNSADSKDFVFLTTTAPYKVSGQAHDVSAGRLYLNNVQIDEVYRGSLIANKQVGDKIVEIVPKNNYNRCSFSLEEITITSVNREQVKP